MFYNNVPRPLLTFEPTKLRKWASSIFIRPKEAIIDALEKRIYH